MIGASRMTPAARAVMDILRGLCAMRQVCKPDLLYHFIGAAEQCNWDREPECLGGLQIDDELHSYHLLDG